MQKLGTGLTISRMVVDGTRVFCERADGSWQSGTDREQVPLELETLPECSDHVREMLVASIQARRAAPPAPAPGRSEEEELLALTRQLSPDVKAEMLALLRLRTSASASGPVSPPPPTSVDDDAIGYVYTDPETGAKRWVAGDLPPETSAAYPCPHCQKVWSSERSQATHARQCAENPDSINYKGLVPEPVSDEGDA